MVQSFIDARPDQIQEVVQTNLLGCLLCTRAAVRLMAAQPRGGHIFNMDGAGADGLPTPQYAAYGATKAGALLPCASPCPGYSAVKFHAGRLTSSLSR